MNAIHGVLGICGTIRVYRLSEFEEPPRSKELVGSHDLVSFQGPGTMSLFGVSHLLGPIRVTEPFDEYSNSKFDIRWFDRSNIWRIRKGSIFDKV